jgi:hypothetical protein
MDYDFADHEPDDIMTDDEQKYFEDAVRFKNKSDPVNTVDFNEAVESTIGEMDELLS